MSLPDACSTPIGTFCGAHEEQGLFVMLHVSNMQLLKQAHSSPPPLPSFPASPFTLVKASPFRLTSALLAAAAVSAAAAAVSAAAAAAEEVARNVATPLS